jgi:hypothetical protein
MCCPIDSDCDAEQDCELRYLTRNFAVSKPSMECGSALGALWRSEIKLPVACAPRFGRAVDSSHFTLPKAEQGSLTGCRPDRKKEYWSLKVQSSLLRGLT